MDPRLRTALVTGLALVLAVVLALDVAEGSFFWPALTSVVIVALVLIRLMGLPADTILLGIVLFGYVVGNRGFAQLTPTPGIPLLPAEAALLVGCAWCAIHHAFAGGLPFRRDALNWAVLAWLVIGTVRAGFDVPRHGLLAIRDFAMVYYAVFFFLAQDMAARVAGRRYLIGCLVAAVVVLGPLFALYYNFTSVFMQRLTVGGAPLIYYKPDLAATHLAAGSLVLFFWARSSQRWWAWSAAAGIGLFLLAFDSRASLLGLVAATALLLGARRWQFPLLQASAAALALAATVMLAVVFDNAWADRKLEGLQDRVASVIDLRGQGAYRSEESSFKGDNNRFRFVWWRNVLEETTQTNPLFGLGFGTDLARGFMQEYFPDSDEDFTARSPHSMLVGSYGRLGAVGVGAWLAICLILLGRTWRSLRRTEDRVTWSLWCGALVILVSATFGVVLEGPMGAVVFWTLLGLANAPEPEPEPATALEHDAQPAALAATGASS